jgi:phosphotransferase system enzyme I (PtsI)
VTADDVIVIDTTEGSCRVWVGPSDALVEEARAKRARRIAEAEAAARSSIDHLGVSLRVNVSSLHDPIPETAEGIGLVRTELLFSHVPSEDDQATVLGAIVAKAKRRPVVVRLFDGGADKPIPWLFGPPEARGFERLYEHNRELFNVQMRAIARVAQAGPTRVLVPYVRSAEDIAKVRASCTCPVGAMIETPEAVAGAREIAAASDFVSIGTNDLSAAIHGEQRERSALSRDPRLLAAIRDVVAASRVEVSICGELASAEPRVLVGLGVKALSVPPSRFAAVRQLLSSATLDECKKAADSLLP